MRTVLLAPSVLPGLAGRRGVAENGVPASLDQSTARAGGGEPSVAGGIVRLLAGILLALGASMSHADATRPDLESATVVWNSPSVDARGSMPLGNGDIGINGWVDSSGDLLFYVGKTDSWEDNGRLAKVGLVRLRLTPPLDARSDSFRQTLEVARGEMVVTTGGGATLRVWVDANQPVIHVLVDSPVEVEASASFEPWRTERQTLPSIEASDVNVDRRRRDGQFQPTVVEPDAVLEGIADGVGWYHHNAKSVGPVESMRQQDLLDAPWRDPILHRTFGGLIRSPSARRVSDRELAGGPTRTHRFDVYVLTRHPVSPEQWLSALRDELQRLRKRLPELPTREVDGVRMLSPAGRFANKRNVENPELYAVYPFRLVSFEKPNAPLGIEALRRRTDRGANGWRQDDLFMSYLGLAEDVREAVVKRARSSDPACRFPAFWGPNYDWTPDQCHGGVLMRAVQSMVMQTEGNAIFLLPAFPTDWNVRFRLHAPGQTIVEGVVEDGVVRRLETQPPRRRDDIVLPSGRSQPSAATRRLYRVMPVGDSITAGGATFDNYRLHLLERLEAAGYRIEYVGSQSSASPRGALRHEGYGGKTAEFVAEILPRALQQHRPDVLLIHAGHNHFSEEKPVPKILRATESMIVAARSVNPRAIVLVGQVIPSGKLPKYDYIPELNAELGRLVARLDRPDQRVVLVNHARDFDWRTDTIEDRVHPNRLGAVKMSERWSEALQQVLER